MKLGNIEVSQIAYGMWRLDNLTLDTVYNNLKQLKELGINVVDTADIYHINVYGESERLIGEAFKKDNSLKDYFKVITKCGVVAKNETNEIKHYDNSYNYIVESAKKSKKNLDDKIIDVYLLHRPDLFMDFEEIYKAFKYLVENKVVLQFGVSNYTPLQFDALNTYLVKRGMNLVTNQIEINPMTTEHYDNDQVYYLKGHEITPMIWSPFAGGEIFKDNDTNVALQKLADKHNCDVQTIALSFLNSQGLNPIIILGSQNIVRYQDALKSLDLKLTPEEMHIILKAKTKQKVK